MVGYSALLFINFLTVFVLMAFLYWKIMKEIKLIKERVGELGREGRRGGGGEGRGGEGRGRDLTISALGEGLNY